MIQVYSRMVLSNFVEIWLVLGGHLLIMGWIGGAFFLSELHLESIDRKDGPRTAVFILSCTVDWTSVSDLVCSDLMSAYEGKFYKIIDVEPVQQLLVQGRRSTMAKTKQVSNWATKEIRKAAKTNQNSWWVFSKINQYGVPPNQRVFSG